jgi:hypothetical protein
MAMLGSRPQDAATEGNRIVRETKPVGHNSSFPTYCAERGAHALAAAFADSATRIEAWLCCLIVLDVLSQSVTRNVGNRSMFSKGNRPQCFVLLAFNGCKKSDRRVKLTICRHLIHLE